MKPSLLLVTVSALNVLLWTPPLPALDPSLDVSQYVHTAWTTQEGSLKSGVRCMTQTSDGYLWLGTEFGLVRFDGARFVPWTPPDGQQLPSTNIRSLAAGRDGTLWIGTVEGLASWKDGKLTRYPEISQQNVLTLLEDREGTLWAGTFQVPRGKLCAIQHGNVHCYGDDGALGQWVWSLYEDGGGRLWVGAETGLWRWSPGPAKRYDMPHAIETSQAVAEDDKRAGLLAIGEGIWQFVNGKITEYQIATPPGRLTPMRMLRDRDGGLWVGTLQRGVLHVHQGRTSVFGQSDGLSSDHTLSLFEDREGDIWVGTADGLDRFRQSSVTSISVKQGLSNPSVESVLVAHDNSVWLSTLDGLNQWKDGRVKVYWAGGAGKKEPAHLRVNESTRSVFYIPGEEQAVTEIVSPGLPDDAVGSLYEDERHRLWVSTPRQVARFEDGRFTTVKEVPSGWVNAITGDLKGGVWISYQDHGLVHWVEGRVVEQVPWSKLGGNVVASSVVPDSIRGGLWLGFFQGGLLHYKDGQIRAVYGKKDGLGDGRVMDVQLDAGGTVWASTEGGLSRIRDGKILTLNRSNGLPCDKVHWTMEVDSSFWLYTDCGLVRVERSELENWAAQPARGIRFTILDRSDGVRMRALLTGYTPRVSKSADGEVWFADLENLSLLDPHHLVFNKTTPPVHIEQITADSKKYQARDGLELPARVRDLTIDYTALSLVAPEKVRFRYKLEGQDKDWREVVNDRKVQYSNLPPKHYRFRVLACNNSGVWNEEGAALDFVIPPAWYQTNWFYTACGAALLAMVWAVYRLRVRQLAAQFNMRLEERVAERTRVARDLHDTLLQSFQAILPSLQAAINMLAARPADARKVLEHTADHASQAIAEARDAIGGLRMSTVEKNDLAVAIRTIAEELARAQENQPPTPFQVLVEGTTRELHPILRDEVYRLVTEALRNAFQHAAAQNIEVEIRYDEKYFRVRVRDDGKGIPSGVLRADGVQRHYGLPGMRERAKLVGGNLTIWTELDSGTEIELTIPGARAYVRSTRAFWHFGKRSATDTDEKEPIERE